MRFKYLILVVIGISMLASIAAIIIFDPLRSVRASGFTDKPITFVGNRQGQALVVYVTPSGQIAVVVYDEDGSVTHNYYSPLLVDEQTESVLVDVCGRNAYVMESGDYFDYYRFVLPDDVYPFGCDMERFTFYVPVAE